MAFTDPSGKDACSAETMAFIGAGATCFVAYGIGTPLCGPLCGEVIGGVLGAVTISLEELFGFGGIQRFMEM